MSTFHDDPHDWRRIPFWHPRSWADHYDFRCQKCGLFIAGWPSKWGARLFFLVRLVVVILALCGLATLIVHVL